MLLSLSAVFLQSNLLPFAVMARVKSLLSDLESRIFVFVLLPVLSLCLA